MAPEVKMGYGCCVGIEAEGRRFITSEEKIESLEEYKKQLLKEAEGVEEVISRIKEAK